MNNVKAHAKLTVCLGGFWIVFSLILILYGLLTAFKVIFLAGVVLLTLGTLITYWGATGGLTKTRLTW